MIDLAVLANKLTTGDLKDKKLSLAALRDVPDSDALQLIKLVLNDDNQQVRSMAIFALGVKQTPESFCLLVKILETDPDYGIRADAAGALGYLEDPRAFEPLIRSFYEDTDWLVRFSAAVSLGNLKDPRAHDALIQALHSPEVILQQAAIAAFGEIGDLSALDEILAFAPSEDWLVRQRLAEALGNLPSEKTVSALQFMAKDSHPQVSEAAQISLARLGASD
ncbi:MAG: HEAT repeat domain-containing protein [Cyanobacteria bacterium P01_C01_bin.118]